jgi:hypothetical protein
MRIEIFVVLNTKIDENTVKNPYGIELEALKAEIIREFGGLTETNEERGYWWNNNEICVDTVRRWIIYTESKDSYEIIEDFAKRIKNLTDQKSQAFGIDGKMYFV